jgi:cardiolipin synthase
VRKNLSAPASKRHWPELIQAGIKIYEYQPTMVHVKLIVVDDSFVSVGSGNVDDRSIRLNDEANLDVLDSQFAAQQMRLFELDKKQSHEMGPDKTGFHPLQQAAGLASPQL